MQKTFIDVFNTYTKLYFNLLKENPLDSLHGRSIVYCSASITIASFLSWLAMKDKLSTGDRMRKWSYMGDVF